MGQCGTRQRNLAQSLIELTITDYSGSEHLPSHLVCWAVIIPRCSSVVRVPSSGRASELEPRWLSSNFFGSDETPRREEWSVSSFSNEVKSPMFEAGDGHKHECLDAFTIALRSYLDYEG